jgi:hypothetical protein
VAVEEELQAEGSQTLVIDMDKAVAEAVLATLALVFHQITDQLP